MVWDSSVLKAGAPGRFRNPAECVLLFARDEPTAFEARIAWRTDEGERRSRTVRHDLDAYRDFPYLEVPRDAPAP